MATPQLSPGVLVREVDLTVGRAENVLDNIGAICAPFPKGPVNEIVDIETEQELINVFGKPLSTDGQYEYWMVASAFLSYGGVLKVVRVDGGTLNNGNAGVGIASTNAVSIDNFDDYELNWDDATNYTYAAKNAGQWSNGLKVCYIDDFADQIIGVATNNLRAAGAVIGYGVTSPLVGVSVPEAGFNNTFTGYLKGIITGITTDTSGAEEPISKMTVKVISRVSAGGTETFINYAQGNAIAEFQETDTLFFTNNSGVTSTTTATVAEVDDWYDEQTLRGLSNVTIFWKTIAPKPTSNTYVLNRNGKNDAINIAIVDDSGKLTGIQGNLLEKHISISKAADTISALNSPQKVYYKPYLAEFSEYIYAGLNPSQAADAYWGTTPRATGFQGVGAGASAFDPVPTSDGLWGQDAQGVTFSSIGNVTYTFSGGVDYDATGGMTASLANLNTAYNKFLNPEVQVDYLLNGPSGASLEDSQAKAQLLISIANSRKDCVACISPHRGGVVNITNSDTQTNNIIKFFSQLPSTSYAIFDSGYKYTYDNYNNLFRYIPCNGDVAGLCVRTSIFAYPWFSPAGQQRGVLNNAIKLAYNPTKPQRDQIYPQRVNAIISKPGIGILLFGDKTALGYSSAFDRINVRRLFLTVEQALAKAAEAQLFELNDSITRSNFVNIVEPYLRDVQAKRGLYGFKVICDETNNTPDIIDNNEFRADIFLKPAKSINYVTLTFVATRTGVSFEEVAGRV